jgi:hypothetical protein
MIVSFYYLLSSSDFRLFNKKKADDTYLLISQLKISIKIPPPLNPNCSKASRYADMLKREKAFEQFLTIAAKAIFSLVLDIR